MSLIIITSGAVAENKYLQRELHFKGFKETSQTSAGGAGNSWPVRKSPRCEISGHFDWRSLSASQFKVIKRPVCRNVGIRWSGQCTNDDAIEYQADHWYEERIGYPVTKQPKRKQNSALATIKPIKANTNLKCVQFSVDSADIKTKSGLFTADQPVHVKAKVCVYNMEHQHDSRNC